MSIRHTWTTTADIPPAAWAAMVADMQALLAVSARSGAEVTNPAGTGAPQLGGNSIGFRVTNPGASPLTVEFARQAGSGEAATSNPLTTGLVVAALERASRWFGPLLTVKVDVDPDTDDPRVLVRARSVARRISTELFDAGDRALTGKTGETVTAGQQTTEAVVRALQTVNGGDPDRDVVARLDAVITQLADERDGWLAAGQLIAPAG